MAASSKKGIQSSSPRRGLSHHVAWNFASSRRANSASATEQPGGRQVLQQQDVVAPVDVHRAVVTAWRAQLHLTRDLLVEPDFPLVKPENVADLPVLRRLSRELGDQ